MFVKKQKKKGFTLIEMLAVIAVIAILVAVVLPVVDQSTTKAAAATNAANLRGVEGVVASYWLDNSDAFNTDNSAYIINLAERMDLLMRQLTFDDIRAALANDMAIIKNTTNKLSSRQVLFAENDLITLEDAPITIQAPGAKALSVEGFTVAKGTQMVVAIVDGEVIATYDGMNAEGFARIAEGGDTADMSTTAHSFWDGNGDKECDICKDKYPHTAEEKLEGIIEGNASGKHECKDENADCLCDISGCTRSVHIDDTFGGDGHCNKCVALMPGGSHIDRRGDGGKCDVDGCPATATIAPEKCSCTVGNTTEGIFGIPAAGQCEKCPHKHKADGKKCGGKLYTWTMP